MRQRLAVAATAAAQSEASPSHVVDTGLPRTAVVGVLGGGQLGKMLGQEAVRLPLERCWSVGRPDGGSRRRLALLSGSLADPIAFPPPPHPSWQAKMGVTLKVLDPTPACPASVVAEQTEGSFRDAAAVTAFAQGCDVLTVEIEHIDADAMEVGRSGGRGAGNRPAVEHACRWCRSAADS